MEQFDKKLRELAQTDQIQVPESLRGRMESAMEPKKRLLGRRMVILAAAICVLGSLAAGATYRITREDLGSYKKSAQETTGETHLVTPEEAQAEEDQYAAYTAQYADPAAQDAAISAAETAFSDQNLWAAQVQGARYEGIQEGREYGCWEAAVVLYLDDGCGYRMILNADTLELIQAEGLTPETMEDEYFQALWDGTQADYLEKAAQGAAG
jgi:hypothetical protein